MRKTLGGSKRLGEWDIWVELHASITHSWKGGTVTAHLHTCSNLEIQYFMNDKYETITGFLS